MLQPYAADRCPACHGKTSHFLDWPFSGLGESVFNTIAAFHACPECGLVYIANLDDTTLSNFYKSECAYFSSDHFDINSGANIEKYKAYQRLLVQAGLMDSDILDVGCGRGGFLLWLKQHHWKGLCQGVDADPRSIPEEETLGSSIGFAQGDAFHLPAANRSQEVLTYFHVLEHLRDLDRALIEASRVLKNGGHLLIEVPDAERYAELPIGTAFWFGIREHVNHFSPAALENLLRRHGLKVLRIDRSILPTPEFSYPSLLLLAKKSENNSPIAITSSSSIAGFLLTSRMAQASQAAWVEGVMARRNRSVFWGCSAQLFSLLPLLDLSQAILCDASPLKQSSNYQGVSIQAPADIHPGDASLIIAPYLHRPAIRRAALALGWDDSNIFALE